MERGRLEERFWYWLLFSERPRNQRCRGCCVFCRDYLRCCAVGKTTGKIARIEDYRPREQKKVPV